MNDTANTGQTGRDASIYELRQYQRALAAIDIARDILAAGVPASDGYALKVTADAYQATLRTRDALVERMDPKAVEYAMGRIGPAVGER